MIEDLLLSDDDIAELTPAELAEYRRLMEAALARLKPTEWREIARAG